MRIKETCFKLVILIFFFSPYLSVAQKADTTHSPLWQIKDPVSKHISYIFGTVHLFGASWLDSITVVKDKFRLSTRLIVEDTSTNSAAESAKKPATDLVIKPHEVFSGKYYPMVNNYLKSIGWINIDTLFGRMPQHIMALWFLEYKTTSDYTSRFHISIPDEDIMDDYFAKQAVVSRKAITSLDDGAKVVSNLGKADYKGLAKDIEENLVLLQETQTIPSKKFDDILEYKNLQYKYYLDKPAPKSEEKNGIDLTLRNNQWSKKLNKVLREDDCFIAVGIDHLNYKSGLINLLLKLGFEVTPVKIERTKK